MSVLEPVHYGYQGKPVNPWKFSRMYQNMELRKSSEHSGSLMYFSVKTTWNLQWEQAWKFLGFKKKKKFEPLIIALVTWPEITTFPECYFRIVMGIVRHKTQRSARTFWAFALYWNMCVQAQKCKLHEGPDSTIFPTVEPPASGMVPSE